MPDIDTSELLNFANRLALAPEKVIPAIVPTAQRAGNDIKRTMRRDASGHSHLPGLARTVEYDVTVEPSSVTVEVGFRKEGQGNLGNIAAFGSVNNPPVMDITRGLTDEVPKFVRWASQAIAEVI